MGSEMCIRDRLVRMEDGKILEEDAFKKMEEMEKMETIKHAEETESAI